MDFHHCYLAAVDQQQTGPSPGVHHYNEIPLGGISTAEPKISVGVRETRPKMKIDGFMKSLFQRDRVNSGKSARTRMNLREPCKQ